MKDFKDLKIAVAGTGYVGLAMLLLMEPAGMILFMWWIWPKFMWRLLNM